VNLRARIQKVEARVPRCDGRIRKVVFAGYVPTEADRCRLCGGYHILVIKKVIVQRHPITGELIKVPAKSVNS
jgi:hypothetical protein